jgi:hypothetical protein
VSWDGWEIRASCRHSGVDFHPDPSDEPAEQLAKSVCRGCPVRGPCLDRGRGERGIWGGLTEAERARLPGDCH